MVLSASPPVHSSVIVLLDQIANELSQDQHLLRIKKLLLYVCTGTWEHDPNRVDRASLRGLVQQLFEISLTFEQLQHQLNQAVASLNKSAEYTILANMLISRFHAVYSQENQAVNISRDSYQAVAQRLEQEAEPVRIKKLLLLTCRSTWENNATTLAQLNSTELVQELYQIAPTAETLRLTLNQVAKALSKPAEYAAIAETISAHFQTLYEHTAEQQATDQQTAILPSQTLLKAVPNRSTTVKATAVKATESTAAKTAKPVLRVLTFTCPQKTTDLFNLRLEIMLDVNPLKAKILLFSLLHEPFRWNPEHEAMLKTHELEELLRILFLSYKLYSEATSKLRQTAQQLGSEEFFQAAEAIIRAIEPFYAEVLPATVPIPACASEVTNMKADTNEVTLPEQH
jgi:hypothetical protein